MKPLPRSPAAATPGRQVLRLEAHAVRGALDAGISAYADFGIDPGAFGEVLGRLAARRLQRSAEEQTRDSGAEALQGLLVADLYLAHACDLGIEAAWGTLHDRFLVALTRRALRCRVGAVRAEAEAIALLGDMALPPPPGRPRTLIGTYDGSGTLLGWMSVILVRRLFRKGQPVPHHGLREHDASKDREGRTGNAMPQAWELASNAETAERLRRGMAEAWSSMTDHETLVVVFKHGHGLRQREIARMLGLSEPTCSRIATAALAKVKASVLRALGGDVVDAAVGAQLWRELEQVVAAKINRTVLPDTPMLAQLTAHRGNDQ